MELSISDRLILLSILPAQGTILTIRLMRELRESLSFTEEELVKYKISAPCRVCGVNRYNHSNEHELDPDHARVSWEQSIDTTKDVKVGAAARQLIVDTFTELDKKGDIREEHLSLLEKFEL